MRRCASPGPCRRLKAARVASIPAAGKRVWPADGEEFDYGMELARIGIYMNTPNAGVANGVMEYEGWRTLKVDPGTGDDSRVSMYSDWFDLEGRAGIEGNYLFYMNDSGL